ncbi:polysaccharide biosynthesis C-terminal domain-containing protein [Companilactobacillus insicii]|uniref:oligosaccharide flippase family protein n=1 Tax=Companilactobacillus insicii TaxID=1732567 RepID=UPI000F778E41|nr:polysaccharide biosynthesis C-terminal domain-containing protein [Companilactobacillus insicii]
MKVVKNYLYNAFYQVFILLVPLVTTPYLARVLGPTGVGINSYTNSVIQYFIVFGSIGVDLYGNRQIAFVRSDRQQMTQTFYEIFFMRIITIILAYAAFGVFLVLSGQYQTYYLAQSVSLIAAAFDISWFFMGMENFYVTVIRNFVIKILTLISIFTFVKSYSDLGIYIFILSMSLLLGNLTLFPSLKRYLVKVDLHNLSIWRHLKPSLILFLPQVAMQIYGVLNKTMLGVMVSVQSTGYFDQSDKMVKMALAIVTATGTVMLPHVANAFAKGEVEKTRHYLYQSFRFVSAIAIPIALGLMAVTAKFVTLFFTKRFLAVIPIMIIESVVIILIAWSNVLGIQYLIPTKQMRSYTISVVIGAVVNIIFNIPLIIKWGAVGATIATVLSEFSITAYQLFSIRKQIDYRELFKDWTKYIVSGVLMFEVVFELDRILPISWKMLILEVFVGMVFYTVLLILFKTKIIDEAKSLIHNRKK